LINFSYLIWVFDALSPHSHINLQNNLCNIDAINMQGNGLSILFHLAENTKVASLPQTPVEKQAKNLAPISTELET
jgi:hypothetical protein